MSKENTPSAKEFIKKKKDELPKIITPKDIGRKTCLRFEIQARTFLSQNNLPEKLFFIERLKKLKVEKEKLAYPHAWQEGDIEYRIGYYIIGQIGKRKGKWTFGQFCPIIPQKDLFKLINQAKKEKTIL